MYVIPDIHGAVDLLEKCLTRILPLRNKGTNHDVLVFLGDYIDRHKDSHLVIDTIINLQKQYPDQVFCIKGNHEHMLLMGLELIPNYLPHEYSMNWKMWLDNGGSETLVGYLERSKTSDLMVSKISSLAAKKFNLIPDSHIDFMMNCLDFYETDDFVFVHGGGNPKIPWEKHNNEVLYWDRSLFKFVKFAVANDAKLINWDKCIITGHNGPYPFFHEKFCMLDSGSPHQLLMYEAYSREAFLAENNKSRLVKVDTIPTKVKPASFKRV
jgi:serine/threonine protein phosphatase 1